MIRDAIKEYIKYLSHKTGTSLTAQVLTCERGVITMDGPRVSILLPTYNRANLLEECINSVLKQDFINWELIILDDCSSDNTYNICKKFVDAYNNIYYNRNDIRRGLPGNRNIGINLSKGELVFFIEDDLLLNYSCLRILVETFDSLRISKKVGGVAPRLILIDQSAKKLRIVSDTNQISKTPFIFNRFTGEIHNNYSIKINGVVETFTIHACSLYEKKLLENVGGYAERSYKGNYKREESDLNFRIKTRGYRFYFQSDAVAYHKKTYSGGCSKSSLIISEYFTIRNHIVFLYRNFGTSVCYMVPMYILIYVFRMLKFLLLALISRIPK